MIAWLAAFFLLGFVVWELQAGHLMIFIFLALSMLAYGIYAFTARCARCRMPILLRPVRLFGMEIYRWSLLVPERCHHCGKLLP